MLWNNTLFGYKFKGKTYVLTTTTSLHLSRRRPKHENEDKLTSIRSLSLIENFSSGRRRSRNRRACLRSLILDLKLTREALEKQIWQKISEPVLWTAEPIPFRQVRSISVRYISLYGPLPRSTTHLRNVRPFT